MAASHALFPGTFDPPTVGHLDLIRRGAALFEHVTVALASNPDKQPLFSRAERRDLLQACLEDLPTVSLALLDGLVVDACAELGCSVILRGLRHGTDFDYESPMARTNRSLPPHVDTLFLAASPTCAHVSATLVRQVARLGGPTTELVPEPVERALRERFENQA